MLVLAMIGILAIGPARAASDVFVLQDGTPLVSKPGVGGKILLWVDTGFPLIVVGREGDWLKVSGARLKAGSDTLWVPAARVGRHLPGTLDIAYSKAGPSPAPEGETLLLEVIGTQEIRVRAHCRIVQPGKDDFIDVVDETPLELEVSGPTADCTVRKLGDSGTINVALRTADGRPIATASTYTQHGAVRVRTIGPWGGASGFRLPTRFVFLKDPPDNSFPPGNPVPPLRNATPALGNPVPPFQQSPVPAP
ncbi:MAG: hypothetical protein ACREU7_14665 [Burkholderiales bacterium]